MMQDDSKILYKIIGEIIKQVKNDKGIKYTELCYENDIPTSTYDDIVNGKNQATFYNIAKIIKALGLTYEEFGSVLDSKLPQNFMQNDD